MIYVVVVFFNTSFGSKTRKLLDSFIHNFSLNTYIYIYIYDLEGHIFVLEMS